MISFRATTHRQQIGAVLAVVCVAGIVAYGNSLGAAFTLDNKIILLQDPRLQSVSWSAIKAIFTHDYWWPVFPSNLYRPLTTLTFWLNYAVFGNGSQVGGYHAVNLLLHLINASWVAVLAGRIARSPVAALLAGLVFVTHPVTVEAVTNLVGRADLLATLCVLAALDCHWRDKPFGVVAATIAGVLCKENAIAVLPAIAAIDWLGLTAIPRRRITSYWTLLPALAVFFAIQLTIGSNSPLRGAYFLDNPIVGASRSTAILTAAAVQAKSLGLLVWPATLSCDYSYDQLPRFGSGAGPWNLSAGLFFIIAAVMLGLIWRARRQPLLVAGLVCYLVFLLPTANVLKVIGAIMAERFLYLPLVGFAWAVGAGGAYVGERWRRPAWAVAAALGLAAALAVRTHRRNEDWQTDQTLWRSAVAAAPQSYKTHKGLAAAIAEGDSSEAGIDRAIAEAKVAEGILDRPEINDHPERQETTVKVDLAQYELAKANFRRAAHDEAGARGCLAQAIEVLQRSEKIDHWVAEDLRQNQLEHGERPETIHRLGREDIYQTLAIALAQSGRVPEAVQAAIEAIHLNPLDPAAFEFLASCENRLGKSDAAIRGLFLATFANPHFGRAKDELTVLLRRNAHIADPIWSGTGDNRTINAANPALRARLIEACRRYERLLREEHYSEEATAYRVNTDKTWQIAPTEFSGAASQPALEGF